MDSRNTALGKAAEFGAFWLSRRAITAVTTDVTSLGVAERTGAAGVSPIVSGAMGFARDVRNDSCYISNT